MMRQTTSLILFLSGIIVTVSSFVLFIGPPVHIAYFTQWQFLGLDRTYWNMIHTTIGFLFIIALILHTWYNWRVILIYLKNKTKNLVVLTKPFIIALLINSYVFIGSFYGLPPMKQLLLWGHLKNKGCIGKYRVFPYGQTELSPLYKIATYMGKSDEECIQILENNNMQIKSLHDTISEVAKQNETTVDNILELLKN